MNIDYVIGLDPSLTGFGVVVKGMDGVLYQSSTIKPKSYGAERLLFIRGGLESILSSLPHPKNSVVFCESYGFGIASNIFQLGTLHGVVQTMLYEHEIPMFYVTPTQLKKYVTGKGTSQKSDMKLATYKQWQWEGADDNQVDAYGLAKIGWSWVCRWDTLGNSTKEKADVIKSVIKYNKDHNTDRRVLDLLESHEDSTDTTE